MTATAFYVAKLQLSDFEIPAIPDGYRLYSVEVGEAKSHRRGKQFECKKPRWSNDSRTPEAYAIDQACEHVIHDIGWTRASITLWLTRNIDDAEGNMAYDCDSDTWEVTLADAEGGEA